VGYDELTFPHLDYFFDLAAVVVAWLGCGGGRAGGRTD
jgi:hypothetical protein